VCFEKGFGVQQDVSRAVELYKQAAELGDGDARIFYINHLLKDDKKCSAEDFFLIQAYLRSVINDEPSKFEAFFYMGYLFENGLGVDFDRRTALSYYR